MIYIFIVTEIKMEVWGEERNSTSWYIFVMSELLQINIYSTWNLKVLINYMIKAMMKDFLCKIPAEKKKLSCKSENHHCMAPSFKSQFHRIYYSWYENFWYFKDVFHCSIASSVFDEKQKIALMCSLWSPPLTTVYR